MNLLTLNQAKMIKSQRFKHLSAVLQLAPAFKYSGQNTCPYAGTCKAFCLQHTGHNRFDAAKDARERRTKLWYDDRDQFLALLRADIEALERKAKREGLKPTIRLNGLSDLRWEDEAPELFKRFPRLQFIDYTKDFSRMFVDLPDNYHLTYSLNEKSSPDALDQVFSRTRYNAAQVFTGDIPSTFRGYPVISGDESDLRHRDPRGHVVGLRFKLPFPAPGGKARRPQKETPFIIFGD